MINIYAAGISGECAELPRRFSGASDVEELYARFSMRFPQLKEILSQAAHRDSGPDAVVNFIGQTYRSADPSLDAIPRGRKSAMTHGAREVAKERRNTGIACPSTP